MCSSWGVSSKSFIFCVACDAESVASCPCSRKYGTVVWHTMHLVRACMHMIMPRSFLCLEYPDMCTVIRALFTTSWQAWGLVSTCAAVIVLSCAIALAAYTRSPVQLDTAMLTAVCVSSVQYCHVQFQFITFHLLSTLQHFFGTVSLTFGDLERGLTQLPLCVRCVVRLPGWLEP